MEQLKNEFGTSLEERSVNRFSKILDCTNNVVSYIFLCGWKEVSATIEDCKVTLIQDAEIWVGDLSKELLTTYSERTKLPYEDFIGITTMAFTGGGAHDMSYKFIYETQTIDRYHKLLRWKRCSKDEDIKIIMGEMKLKKVSMEYHLGGVLEYCQGKIADYANEVSALHLENSRLNVERLSALRKYEAAVKSKETLENELYSKFVAVLNSKKAKIRSLKEELLTDRNLQETEDPPTGCQQISSPVPSCSKSELSAAVKTSQESPDLDLNLELDQSDDVNMKRSRRRRCPARERKAPTRVTLPRLASSVKTGSSLSNMGEICDKSNEPMDSEDLIGNL